ncbi:MAG: alpha-galactosidase, partial [Actinomycetota bacterium]|nr:alpha-galactosidase [Actinomycetota bacterium]
RAPQRRLLQQGAWVRDSRHGRTGHDSTLLMAVGTAGFGFGHGEVWAVHTAWSGDHTTWAERLPTGEGVIGGGELLAPGELSLQPDETYVSPWLYATWSDEGLDGVTARLHDHLRARLGHPRRDRPVVLNTWEAVYFDHDLTRLTRLADAAASLGGERFVLDDGWFAGRRDDRRGLGDWVVDAQVWPAGLHPLVNHVRGLGMEFGLWVEPEMVNRDSDVARAHPDWVLGAHDDDPPGWRHQQVLDLTNPAAYAYVCTALLALLDEYDIAFLKWDMNRDLVDTGGAVHRQTLALYRLLDELRQAHPDLEIESCASGGARVDLGILEHTDRVWASDCNDALERQQIQRWTGLVVPPELVGCHVGPATAHTTGRTHRLSFRAATALFGHFGLEWDVSRLPPAESAELAGWIELYRAERALLHSGRVVRGDHPDPALWVHGVVSAARDQALFAVVAMETSAQAVPLPVRLPGLDPGRHYDVEVAGPPPAVPPPLLTLAGSWTDDGVVRVAGSVVTELGLALPTLAPESALVLRARAVVDRPA